MINKQKQKNNLKFRRKIRVRSKLSGSASRPRVSVYRSLGHIYAQLINDVKGETLVSASDLELGKNKGKKKIELALEVGKTLAKKALDKKIKKVIFDRSIYKYHGRIKAVADGLREGGLEF